MLNTRKQIHCLWVSNKLVSDLIAVFPQINHSTTLSQRISAYFKNANYYFCAYAHSHKNKEDMMHNKMFESKMEGLYGNVCAYMPSVFGLFFMLECTAV